MEPDRERGERPELTPPGLDCAACGYELGGMPVRVCPECGRGFGEEEMEACRRRTGAIELLPEAVRRVRVLGTWYCVAVVAGAIVVSRDISTAAMAGAICVGALAVSWIIGWGVAATARSVDQPALRLAWTQSVLWLNGFGLMAPLALAVAIASMVVAKLFTKDDPNFLVLAGASVLIGGLWIIAGIRCMVIGGRRFNKWCDHFRIRESAWRGLATLGMFIVSLTTILTGFAIMFGGLSAAIDAGWIER